MGREPYRFWDAGLTRISKAPTTHGRSRRLRRCSEGCASDSAIFRDKTIPQPAIGGDGFVARTAQADGPRAGSDGKRRAAGVILDLQRSNQIYF